MRTGTLTHWDDAKGYGFITPEDGGQRLFVHVKAFGLRSRRPFEGERYRFRVGVGESGRPQVVEAKPVEAVVENAARPYDASSVTLLVPAFALLVLVTQLWWGLPKPLWGIYTGLSMATYLVYWLDKRAARRGGPRVSERTLHGLALIGGWPGALLAQQLLRHKTRKVGFRRWFWAMVVTHVLGFVLMFTPLYRVL